MYGDLFKDCIPYFKLMQPTCRLGLLWMLLDYDMVLRETGYSYQNLILESIQKIQER